MRELSMTHLMLYLMYQYHLQAAKVVDHRLHVNNKRRADETEAEDQEQYLTHYEPLIIENGLFVCLKPTKTESSSAQSLLPAWKMPAARSAVTQEHVRNTQNKEIHLPQICKSENLRWKSPACIKERLSTSAHTSQSPTKNEKKEKQQRPMRIRRVVSHAFQPAASPPEASRSTSTPLIRSSIITVVVKVYFVSYFCNFVQAFYCMAVQFSS